MSQPFTQFSPQRATRCRRHTSLSVPPPGELNETYASSLILAHSRLVKSVMWRNGLTVCPVFFISSIQHAAHTQCDSPGGSIRSDQHTVGPNNKEDRHTCMKTWRNSQNRKYRAYRIAVRGGPSHGHRQHVQKIRWYLDVWFLRYTSRQTKNKQTDKHTDTLITTHCTPTAVKNTWNSLVSDVVEKTSTRRRSRIPCVVVEKTAESRRTFNKNSCDLLTAITHTEFLVAI